jgi:type IV pilus assembly protein PilY1
MTPLFTSPTAITASPTASIDEHDNVWVYFGTGRYYNDADKSDVSQQYFYGIKDPCPWGGCNPATDEVQFADLYNSNNIIVLTNNQVVNATATTWDGFVDEVQAEDGWYLTLAAGGERVLNRPSVLGGVVLTAPFTPDDDICGFGGTGALYAMYYETGTAYFEPILGTKDYLGDDESIIRVELDKGLTSEIGLHVGKKVESTGFIQQGSGEVIQVEVDPALDIKSGIVGWQQY